MSQANLILVRLADHQVNITVPGIAIPYILDAEPFQPSDMSNVQCPFFVNEVRGGPANLPIANGQQYISTDYWMRLALSRRGANIDLKYSVQNALLWRDAVFAYFAQHIKLSAPTVSILSSTNASPIVVTTGNPHCLNPLGDQVVIANHLVNTNANGSWNAVVIDNKTFSLTGSTGNGVGAATGTARMLQNGDMNGFITDSHITNWDLNNYAYGSTEWIALTFILRVNEMYVQTVMP